MERASISKHALGVIFGELTKQFLRDMCMYRYHSFDTILAHEKGIHGVLSSFCRIN